MNDVALQSITTWFRSYVDRFRSQDNALPPMMQFKLAHTERVARFGRTIAERTGWPSGDTNLAEAGGWLHDVGRFSQWADYSTYRDRISIDHAARGCEVLHGEHALDEIEAPESAYLMDAVALHNRLALPDSLSPACRPLCELVRDADKLDIFDVVYGHLTDGNLGDVVPLLSSAPEANPDILEEIRVTHRASYTNVRTHADFVLVSVAWAWDLCFAATAQMAQERRVITRLLPFLPDSADVRSVVDAAVEQLRHAAA